MKRFLMYAGLILFAGGACQKKTVEPTACQFVVTIANETYAYQFDTQGRVTSIAYRSASEDVDYTYAYQGKQATIDITYPRPGADWLRFHYDVTLNEQGHVLTAQETMYNRLANGTVDEHLITAHTCTYDAQGYLTTYHFERYSYPYGMKPVIETQNAQLTYQDGNPVMITFSSTASGQTSPTVTMANKYGTQTNTLKMAFLLEANPFGFSPEKALQPLLGKPPRTLITSSDLKSNSVSMTTTYTYQFDQNGQLTRVGRAGPSAPFGFMFENTCP